MSMKHVTTKLFSTLLLAVVILFTACSKDGEEGPAGPAGPQGPAGPNGPTGAQGEPGTANVIYSAWLNVEFESITEDSSVYLAEIDAPMLDSLMLNKGDMKVFLNAGTLSDPLVIPLPTLDILLTGIIINPYFQKGKILLSAAEDASSFTDEGSGEMAWQYRYVLIPGGTAARKYMLVDWNDYKQVKAFLNLQD